MKRYNPLEKILVTPSARETEVTAMSYQDDCNWYFSDWGDSKPKYLKTKVPQAKVRLILFATSTCKTIGLTQVVWRKDSTLVSDRIKASAIDIFLFVCFVFKPPPLLGTVMWKTHQLNELKIFVRCKKTCQNYISSNIQISLKIEISVLIVAVICEHFYLKVILELKFDV